MKLIFWGGILLFIGGIILAISSLDDIKVEMNGKLVKMRIEKLPRSCIGTRINHYARFSYDDMVYIKQIPPEYCDKHHVGEFVEMKFLNKHSVILFPNESAKRELFAAILLGLVGFGISIAQWKKYKK